MKKILFMAMAFAGMMFVSCAGEKATPAEAAEAAKGVFTECGLWANVSEPVASGDAVDVTYQLTDSLISTEYLTDDLMNYVMAYGLKGANVNDFNAFTEDLIKSKSLLKLTVMDVYGQSNEFEYTGAELRTLAKTKLSQMNVSKIKQDVAAMAMSLVPNAGAHAGAEVSTGIESGFINYTITFPSASAYAGHSQGLITTRYIDWLKDYYQPGSPVVELLKSLDIDGIRITYTAPSAEKSLNQAFPWRTL